MKPTLEWLSDPEIYQVGREPAHSDHRFYTSYEEMRQHPGGKSASESGRGVDVRIQPESCASPAGVLSCRRQS